MISSNTILFIDSSRDTNIFVCNGMEYFSWSRRMHIKIRKYVVFASDPNRTQRRQAQIDLGWKGNIYDMVSFYDESICLITNPVIDPVEIKNTRSFIDNNEMIKRIVHDLF